MSELKFYVARDGDGELRFYHGKPTRYPPKNLRINEWYYHQGGDVMSFPIDHVLGEGLTWEDEPREVSVQNIINLNDCVNREDCPEVIGMNVKNNSKINDKA